MACDVMLTGPVQIEMDHVIRTNTAAMNEEQLQTHIQEVNRGLVALTQLPTTNRLHELLTAQQSAKDAETWTSALLKEMALTQQRLKEVEGRTPECTHRDLDEKVRDPERQLRDRAPEQTELAGNLEDAQAQLEVMRKTAEEYREQVTGILRPTEGRTGGGGNHEDKEEKGSEIACFSGEDRKEIRRWKVQLALKIAGKPRTFDTEQKKLRYAVGRLEKVALAQIMPYCDKVSRKVNLDSLKSLVDMLELAFGDHNKAATAKREHLRVQQRDHEFSL
jgi:hypothetical protein